jgi:hypothetical protein
VRPGQRGAALPGNTPGVEEEFEPTHAVDPPKPGQPSFDDDVAARKAPPAKPARGFTASLPRPVPLPESDPDADTIPPTFSPAPSDVFAGKDSFAAPIPQAPSPQRPTATKKVQATRDGSIPSALKLDDKDFGALDDPTGADVEVTPHSPTKLAPEDKTFSGADPRLAGAMSVPIIDIPMDSSPSVTPVETPIEPPEPTAYVDVPAPEKAPSVEPIDPADPTRAAYPLPGLAPGQSEEPSGFTVEISVMRSTQEGEDPFAQQPAPSPQTLLHDRPTALVAPRSEAPAPVEMTPPFQRNVPTQSVHRERDITQEVDARGSTQELARGSTQEIALANDETRVRAPSRAPMIVIGLVAFVVVSSLGVVAAWRTGLLQLSTDTTTNVVVDAGQIVADAAPTPPVSPPPVSPPPVSPPPVSPPPVSPPPVSPPPVSPPPVSPPPATPLETAPPVPPPVSPPPVSPPRVSPPPVSPPPVSPVPTMPTTWVRAPDGFGPFIERAGFPGAGTALGRGVRKAIGDAISGSKLGVRGEIRRVDVKKTEATAECLLYVFDNSGPRATLRATARSEIDPTSPRDRAVKSAAEACGASLESDLRAAIAHAGK